MYVITRFHRFLSQPGSCGSLSAWFSLPRRRLGMMEAWVARLH